MWDSEREYGNVMWNVSKLRFDVNKCLDCGLWGGREGKRGDSADLRDLI